MVPIRLTDDAILAVDEDGEPLLRLGFALRVRGSRDQYREVICDFPTLGDFPQYQRDCAMLFQLMAQGVPDAFLPDDMEKVKADPEGYRSWAYALSVVVGKPSIAGRLLDLVTTYLDPWVDGIDGDAAAQSAWVRANMTPAQAVEMLALILCTQQLIEKKTRFGLMMIFQMAMPPRSSSGLPRTPGAQPTTSSAGLPRGLTFSSGGTPSTHPPSTPSSKAGEPGPGVVN